MAPPREQPAQAEELAAKALAFLASDQERLWQFLDLTGLAPDRIRAIAHTPGFVLAVLDHLLSDESLLLAFAAEAGVDPASIMRARMRLAGPDADGLREG